MSRRTWWRNKTPVIIARFEVLAALDDLLRYYENAAENINTIAAKQALKEILKNEVNNYDYDK